MGQSGFPFRIDHDEAFNMTAHLQYQTPWKRGPWFGFNWRYDSGLVAGAVPCYGVLPFNDCPTSTTLNGQPAVDLSGLSADEEFQAGLFCGSVKSQPLYASADALSGIAVRVEPGKDSGAEHAE